MSVQQPRSPAASSQDLEITAELPVLDVAGVDAESREARTGESDSWSSGNLAPAQPMDADMHPELHATTRQLRELEERLHSKNARLIELELALETVQEERRAAAERLLAAEAARNQADEREARLPELARTLIERDRLIADLRHALAAAQEQSTSRLEMLQTLEARRGLEAAEPFDRETAEREARLANMEAELVRRSRRTSELETELDTRAARIEALAAEVSSVTCALDTERAAHERAARESAEQVSLQTEALAALRGELHRVVGRSAELEGDLRAAEDTIHRLEAELRGKSQRLEELARASEQGRTRRPDRPDGVPRRSPSTGAGLADFAPAEPGAAIVEPLPDGARRLLVRKVGDSEVVHVLGRKTTVGRTPDNDLQIDARFISRHHAVILAGPVQTVIEDLNSTNGVRVNSRRVTRQALRDGDIVIIGKTRFRFSINSSAQRA